MFLTRFIHQEQSTVCKSPNSILYNKETTSEAIRPFFFFFFLGLLNKMQCLREAEIYPFLASPFSSSLDCISSYKTAQLSSHRSHAASQWVPPPHTKALSLVKVQKEKELNKSNLYLSSIYSTNRRGPRAPPSLMQGYDPKAKTICMYEG